MSVLRRFKKSISHFASLNPLTRFASIKRIVDEILENKEVGINGVYLDVGCQKGHASLAFSSNFSEIVNLDVNKREIRICKRKFCATGFNAHFIVADACALPFRKSCFNVVSTFSVIEHIENQFIFLREVSEVLAERGILLMQFPNKNFFIEPHTGMPLPGIVPERLFRLFSRYAYGRSEEVGLWNLTKKRAMKMCKPFFNRIYIEKCNYEEEIIHPKIKLIYRLFKKLKILDLCPLGWVFVCLKNPKI